MNGAYLNADSSGFAVRLSSLGSKLSETDNIHSENQEWLDMIGRIDLNRGFSNCHSEVSRFSRCTSLGEGCRYQKCMGVVHVVPSKSYLSLLIQFSQGDISLTDRNFDRLFDALRLLSFVWLSKSENLTSNSRVFRALSFP